MKELRITIALIITVASMIISIPVFATTSREYMTVVSVTRETGSIVVIDRNGDLWEFRGYGFSLNEVVLVDMYNNGNEDKYDNVIVDVRKVR